MEFALFWEVITQYIILISETFMIAVAVGA